MEAAAPTEQGESPPPVASTPPAQPKETAHEKEAKGKEKDVPEGKERPLVTPTKVGVEVFTPNSPALQSPQKKADPVSAAATLVVSLSDLQALSFFRLREQPKRDKGRLGTSPIFSHPQNVSIINQIQYNRTNN